MKLLLTLITLAFLFANCKPGNGNTADSYFVPLKDVPFNISTIDSGTQIKLIAFSGGSESNKEAVYYPQFIGVTNEGYTIRVFTPLISTGPTNTYTTPFLFDHKKGVDLATIQPKDSSTDVSINLYTHTKELNGDASELGKLLKKSDAPEMAVMIKGVSLFESKSYKTVIGVLHFDEVPW